MNCNYWFYSGTQFWSFTLDIPKRHLKQSVWVHNSICNVELNCANAQMRNCHFSPSNNHYLYNIASLTRRNPLPPASHVPASASDVNRIKKQDPSPPFTFCSFQPLDILLSSFHWPTSSSATSDFSLLKS